MADFEINKRLQFLIKDVFKTTPHAFSQKYNDKAGVKTSQVIRERNGLSMQMLEQIITAYPEINRSWLLTGKGEMLKNAEKTLEVQQSNSDLMEIIRMQNEQIMMMQKTQLLSQENLLLMQKNLTSALEKSNQVTHKEKPASCVDAAG